jgi:SNF2 family DNA or RNA helicase
LLKWWELDPTDPSNSSSAQIPFVDFAIKIQWLRTNWGSRGLSFALSDQFKASFHALQQQKEDFNKVAHDDSLWPYPEFLRTELVRQLTDFQERNVAQLIRMSNGANFSVPGAGKTSTALAVWQYFASSGSIDRLLVVCPRSAFEAWTGESKIVLKNPPPFQTFGNSPIIHETRLLLTNYEQLESQEKLSRLAHWASQGKTLLVLDEAHRVKGGSSSVRWRATEKLAQVAGRTDVLTGTPMPQAYDDLRNLFSLAWRGIPSSFFSDSLLKSLPRGGAFVRTTKDELGLPPVNYHTVKIPMGEIQHHVYTALRRSYKGLFRLSIEDEATLAKRGRAVFALLGAATNPGLLMSTVSEDSYLGLSWPPREIADSKDLMSIVSNYANHEIPPKYEWVIRFIKEASSEGKKVLVWSNLVGNLRALDKFLQPFNPALVYGALTGEERDIQISKFRNDPDCGVLITNPQTLGEGISLHDCCHVAIYVDRSYNAGHYLQSLDRIHRLGLAPDQVTDIYLLETEGTIDEKVYARLEIKVSRLAEAMGDRGLVRASLPDELGWENFIANSMDDEDSADLYKHLMDND